MSHYTCWKNDALVVGWTLWTGRKLTVRYAGLHHSVPRDSCCRDHLEGGESRCIAFRALGVDDAIEDARFEVASAGAVETRGKGRRGMRTLKGPSP